jgi:putative MFS transporter
MPSVLIFQGSLRLAWSPSSASTGAAPTGPSPRHDTHMGRTPLDTSSAPTVQPVPGLRVHPDHGNLIQLLDQAPLRLPHYLAWLLSSGGILLDGLSVFMLGIAIPLLRQDMELTAWQLAFLGGGLIAGAVIGAGSGGRLADRIGRKPVFLLDMALLFAAAVAAVLAWNPGLLILAQTLVGVAVGMDFPVSSSYVAEIMPQRARGRILVATIAAQSVGMILAAFLALGLLHLHASPDAWRLFFATEALLAAFFLVARLQLSESPRWLMSQGRNREAVHAVSRILPEDRRMLEAMASRLADTRFHVARISFDAKRPPFMSLFVKAYRRRTLLSTVPWFLMDMATYGIGMYSAVILAAVRLGGRTGDPSARIRTLTLGNGFIDLFLFLGFLLGIWAVVRFGRIRMQLTGFAGMTLGMSVLLLADVLPTDPDAHSVLIFTGFVIFNLFMNMGPNSTTYVLPAELFPTQLRATGSGFSAAVAKVGAALGVFLLPLVQARVGVNGVLVLMIGVSLLGLLSTWAFRVDDREKTLEAHQARDLP